MCSEVANLAALEGLTPIQVLLNRMRACYEEKDFDRAVAIATAAAPYVHPRKRTVEVKRRSKVTSNHVVEVIVSTREQADAVLARLSDSSGVPRQ